MNADFRLLCISKDGIGLQYLWMGFREFTGTSQFLTKRHVVRPPEELCTRKGTEKTALSSKRCQVSKSTKLPRVRLELTTFRL